MLCKSKFTHLRDKKIEVERSCFPCDDPASKLPELGAHEPCSPASVFPTQAPATGWYSSPLLTTLPYRRAPATLLQFPTIEDVTLIYMPQMLGPLIMYLEFILHRGRCLPRQSSMAVWVGFSPFLRTTRA